MEDLLEHWDDLEMVLGRPPFLILDYDGTLAPIASVPGEAEIPGDIRRKLEKLVEMCPVAILSGRRLEDVESRVGIDGIYYAGNHGYRVQGPGLDFEKEQPDGAAKALDEVRSELGRFLAGIEGPFVEDKGLTLSIHFREADDEGARRVKEAVKEAVKPRLGDVVVDHGKEVLEVKPADDWDKGRAVHLLREATGHGDRVPLYLGDDETDEDVFLHFRREEEGLGILVDGSPEVSAAHFRLRDIGGVRVFLGRLARLFDTPNRTGGG